MAISTSVRCNQPSNRRDNIELSPTPKKSAAAVLIEPFFERQQDPIDSVPRGCDCLFPIYTQATQGRVGQNGQIRSGGIDDHAPF
jgi:hypothetical protein